MKLHYVHPPSFAFHVHIQWMWWFSVWKCYSRNTFVLFLELILKHLNYDVCHVMSGDLYFDKAEGGFLQELFQRWTSEQCTHQVTLAFFWRAYYKRSSIGKSYCALPLAERMGVSHLEHYRWLIIMQGNNAYLLILSFSFKYGHDWPPGFLSIWECGNSCDAQNAA